MLGIWSKRGANEPSLTTWCWRLGVQMDAYKVPCRFREVRNTQRFQSPNRTQMCAISLFNSVVRDNGEGCVLQESGSPWQRSDNFRTQTSAIVVSPRKYKSANLIIKILRHGKEHSVKRNIQARSIRRVVYGKQRSCTLGWWWDGEP
jgi:hypothetical protein